MAKHKISPALWFDKNCEEAINLYIELFNGSPNKSGESKIISIMRYEKGMEAPGSEEMEGKIINAIFELNGQQFYALDGGPLFKFNESVSFLVDCEDQTEVDYFWNKLTTDGGEESQCGWLKDKFGLSWQIIPKQLGELAGDKDPVKAQRVINAMLKMQKIDVAKLQEAHEGK